MKFREIITELCLLFHETSNIRISAEMGLGHISKYQSLLYIALTYPIFRVGLLFSFSKSDLQSSQSSRDSPLAGFEHSLYNPWLVRLQELEPFFTSYNCFYSNFIIAHCIATNAEDISPLEYPSMIIVLISARHHASPLRMSNITDELPPSIP